MQRASWPCLTMASGRRPCADLFELLAWPLDISDDIFSKFRDYSALIFLFWLVVELIRSIFVEYYSLVVNMVNFFLRTVNFFIRTWPIDVTRDNVISRDAREAYSKHCMKILRVLCVNCGLVLIYFDDCVWEEVYLFKTVHFYKSQSRPELGTSFPDTN